MRGPALGSVAKRRGLALATLLAALLGCGGASESKIPESDRLLLEAQKAIAAGDNAAFSTAGAADYLGSIDIAAMQAFTDGAVGYGAASLDEQIDLAADKDSLFFLIEARGAYAPGNAETFGLALEIEQV